MSYNGSGTFNLYTPGNPVVTGTTISSTWANNTLTDIATGLSTAITKNGQTTITANLPMAGFKHTGVGNANARTTYTSAADVQDGTPVYLTSPSGTNTITATAAYSMSAYAAGQKFVFIPAATNTGATTININSIGAKNIYYNNHALSGGEIVASVPVEVMYDGTQFQILGPSIGSAAQTFLGADVLLNNNANYFDGPNTGSIGAAGQKWKITAVMSVIDTAGAATIKGRIWDGTTVYTETVFTTSAANYEGIITAVAIVTLAGAATFYASCRDLTSNNGRIQTTGNAGTANKATYIIAERIS